jgi:hypothetical protein
MPVTMDMLSLATALLLKELPGFAQRAANITINAKLKMST